MIRGLLITSCAVLLALSDVHRPLCAQSREEISATQFPSEGQIDEGGTSFSLEQDFDPDRELAEPSGEAAGHPRCPDCGEWHGLGTRCGRHGSQHNGWLPSSRWLPRHLNHGQPLETSSWLNRPFSFGLFAGTLLGDDLVSGQVQQSGDFIGGLRAGWDFDHYWGTEVRFGWSELAATGTHDPPLSATGSIFLADLVFLHYPWGDARVRPYLFAGIGTASFDYSRNTGAGINEAALALPVGGGIKYLLKPWLAMRFEVVDHLDFGSGQLSTMHNIAITLGLEWRLGGSRRSYYPWHPSRVIR